MMKKDRNMKITGWYNIRHWHCPYICIDRQELVTIVICYYKNTALKSQRHINYEKNWKTWFFKIAGGDSEVSSLMLIAMNECWRNNITIFGSHYFVLQSFALSCSLVKSHINIHDSFIMKFFKLLVIVESFVFVYCSVEYESFLKDLNLGLDLINRENEQIQFNSSEKGKN